MARVTAELINKQNKIVILNLIRQSGAISRAELAKTSGMSAPTVTRIVDSLIHTEKLVKEAGEGSSSGGRRPNLVTFSGEKHFVIGIDLSPRFISAVLTDLNNRIITESRIPTFPQEGFEAIMMRVGQLVRDLQNQSRIAADRFVGIGLGVAGFIDTHKKIILASPNFGWSNVHPDKELAKYTKLPVIYDNLTRVMALGELHYGAGNRFDSFICLKLGMGLGSGVILDRKPFFGSHGYGSEAGHTIINSASSYKCKCGNNGCFEALVSGPYILSRLEEFMTGSDYSSLMEVADPLSSAIAVIQGNPEQYRLLLEELTDHLSIGIVNMIHSYDPEAVILGGVISELGELIIIPLKEKVKKLIVPQFQTDFVILTVAYGEKAVAIGASSLVLEQVLALNM